MKRPELVTQILIVVLIGVVLWMGVQMGHLSAAVAGQVQPAPTPTPGKVDPGPNKVDPGPKPEVKPGELGPPAAKATETPLSRAMRDYFRQAPATLPDTLDAMADKLDNRELADKLSATVFFKKPASAMNAALDQVFSPGIDQAGKVTDPGKISGPLRDSAKALRGAK